MAIQVESWRVVKIGDCFTQSSFGVAVDGDGVPSGVIQLLGSMKAFAYCKRKSTRIFVALGLVDVGLALVVVTQLLQEGDNSLLACVVECR